MGKNMITNRRFVKNVPEEIGFPDIVPGTVSGKGCVGVGMKSGARGKRKDIKMETNPISGITGRQNFAYDPIPSGKPLDIA